MYNNIIVLATECPLAQTHTWLYYYEQHCDQYFVTFIISSEMIPKLFPQAIFGCIWYNILKRKKYMYTNAILLLLYYLEEGEFLYQKAQKKFWAPGENIELMTLQVLVWTLQPLSHRRLYGKQGRNLIITTRTVLSFSPLFISFYLRS